jgi:Carboxypeptidase regulatory-like domain
MRNHIRLALIAFSCIVSVRTAAAQTIRGRLVDATSKAPIVSALVELRDVQGKVVSQNFSSPSGGFVFVAQPNQNYQLRIAAIGYARHAPVDVNLGADPLTVPDIALTAVIVSLPDLKAMSGKRACGKGELAPETFGGLIDVARTSLQLMDATMRSAQLGFQMQIVNRYATRGLKESKDSAVSADTTASTLREWPVKSLALDSLQLFGFTRPATESEGFGHHYYGPDMTVLVSDWFLETHCFSLDKDRTKGDTVVIKYDPIGHPKYVDVSGTIVINREALTTRTVTWELRDLPDGAPDRAAGGEMHFAEKSSGLWVPIDWAIWAPLTKSARSIARPVMMSPPPGQRGTMAPSRQVMSAPPPPLVQVVGRKEVRGRLVRIVPMGGL